MTATEVQIDTKVRDRVRGCFIGLAVGDAVGSTNEFKSRDRCRESPVTAMVGGGPFRLKPGQWTDDTSMAFALAASLVRMEGFSANNIMCQWVNWRQGVAYGPSDGRGCFDIGGTTAAALARFATSGDPWAGSAADHTAANGAIMRLAPVPMLTLWMAEEERRRMADDSARLTHAEPRCRECAVLLAELLRDWMLLPEQPVKETGYRGNPFGVLDNFAATTPAVKEMIQHGRWFDRDADDVKSDGYVIHTLEAALWATYGADSFEDAVLRAANLGGDADTVGAVTGQLAGAWYGYEAIPRGWIGRLDRHDELLALADKLFDLARTRR